MKILSLCLMLLALASCDAPEIKIQLGPLTVSAYPSPTNNQVQVRVQNSSPEMGVLKVFDPRADVVFSVEVPMGEQEYNVSLAGLPKGKYYVIFETNGKVHQSSFLKA